MATNNQPIRAEGNLKSNLRTRRARCFGPGMWALAAALIVCSFATEVAVPPAQASHMKSQSSKKLGGRSSNTPKTTTALPSGSYGVAYSTTLAIAGVVSPSKWTATGTLPAGLLLTQGSGAVTGTPTAVGTRLFDVTETGAGTKMTSAYFSLTIMKASPVVSISLTSTPNTYGTNVGYSSRVTGGGAAPTGTVTFKVGSFVMCTGGVTPSSHLATCHSKLAPVGADTVTSDYGGNANYAVATASTALTIVRAGPTVMIAITSTPSTFGTNVMYTSHVTGAGTSPGGTVAFKIGSATLCTTTVTATSHVASCHSRHAPVGSNTVTVVYGGNADYLPGTASTSLVITRATPGVTVTVTPAGPTSFGTAVTYSSRITGAGTAPSGTVMFTIGSSTMCTAPVTASSHLASCHAKLAPVGNDTVTAVYGGSSNYLTNTASTGLTITKAVPSVTVSATPTPTTFGTNVSYTSHVTGAGTAPTGTVTFQTGSTTMCTAPVTPTSHLAACHSKLASVGVDDMAAHYGGNADYVTGTATITLTVAKASTKVLLSATPTIDQSGANVTYSVAVGSFGGTPGGSITVVIDGITQCTAVLNATGESHCSSTLAPIGTDRVTAKYLGNSQFGTSTSSITLIVDPPPPVITTTSLPAGVVGSPYAATLVVTGGSAPYQWSVQGNSLPPGLNLDSSTGAISGTPEATATVPFTTTATVDVTVSSSDHETATATLPMKISLTAPTITTTSLPKGIVAGSYSAQLAGAGCDLPYSWSISSGSLPPGLSLDTATGAITGTPTAAGDTAMTFTVTCVLDAATSLGPGPFDLTASLSMTVSIAASTTPSTTPTTTTTTSTTVPKKTTARPGCSGTGVGSAGFSVGYWLAGADGSVYSCGNAPFLGSLVTLHTKPFSPIVGIAATPDDKGYWLVATDGGIFAFGDAHFYGSMGEKPLNEPVVGITATPGGGYFEVASDGGLFAFGPGAIFHGSMGGKHLNEPVVGMAETAQGGYYEVATDGGVFSFGPGTHFLGSMGGKHLNKPVVGIAIVTSGGYYELASDGGVFSYGAPFHGSTGCLQLTQPILAMEISADATSIGTATACGFTATQQPGGYQDVAADGGVFSFGNSIYAGSLGGKGISDIVGMANS